MSGIIGRRVSLGQANGPDVDLIVSGTEIYATYETPDGFPVIYDQETGLFCYALVVEGRYTSTGVAAAAAPPPGVQRHAKESEGVRAANIRQRRAQMEKRSAKRTPKE